MGPIKGDAKLIDPSFRRNGASLFFSSLLKTETARP
jgi:hypothetical protein